MVWRQRTALQRLVYRAVYRCEECNHRTARPRSFVSVLNRYVECPRCGNQDLTRLAQKDRIDSTSPNPLRRMLKLLGCPLYHCTFCRMQFRDWRDRSPEARPVSPRSSKSRSQVSAG